MANYSVQTASGVKRWQPFPILSSRKLVFALTLIALLSSCVMGSIGIGKCISRDQIKGIPLAVIGALIAACAVPLLIFGVPEAKRIEIRNVDSFSDEVTCRLENGIFVISPSQGSSDDFFPFAERHAAHVRGLIKEHGAVVFNGFNLSEREFSRASQAITELPFVPYKGDTPRPLAGDEPNIYPSSVVAPSVMIPLHQEVSVGERANMPTYFSFFCIVPPEPGTGQTLLGDALAVTQDIACEMPDLWEYMKTRKVTYTMRYLPENTLHTKWIQWWNPSHGTERRRFGTVDRDKIKAECDAAGLTCVWDSDGWLTVQRREVPAVTKIDRYTVICNQMYLDVFNDRLCGDNFFVRWISYIFARLILYQTKDTMQFDAWFENGRPMTRQEAGQIISITKRHQTGRNWERGDLMILDNLRKMHGRLPYSDRGKKAEEKRRVIVGLSGRLGD
jgi:alpha-ketoglutarate-dependent taurine dioxygenase